MEIKNVHKINVVVDLIVNVLQIITVVILNVLFNNNTVVVEKIVNVVQMLNVNHKIKLIQIHQILKEKMNVVVVEMTVNVVQMHNVILKNVKKKMDVKKKKNKTAVNNKDVKRNVNN